MWDFVASEAIFIKIIYLYGNFTYLIKYVKIRKIREKILTFISDHISQFLNRNFNL